MTGPQTLFDKVWDAHVVADLGGGMNLIHVDRILLHDLSGLRALRMLKDQGHAVRHPELCFAAPDHTVSSDPATGGVGGFHETCVVPLAEMTAAAGIRHYAMGERGFGILHVMGPELGVTLPGATLVCGDSHTCTHGGVGAFAMGIGSSELVHAMVTQTLMQRKPKRLRVTFDGALPDWVSAKDMILHVIGREGAASGDGHAVEYAGQAIRSMSVEGRMTICNLSIEMGAKIGMVAPDDTVFAYLEGRDHAPKGAQWDAAVAHWRGLATDAGAAFDTEVDVDVADVKPQITWGTSPEHVIAVDGRVPDPDAAPDAEHAHALREAQAYAGLAPGEPIEGVGIQWVFIGSCTNSRVEDLRAAARVLDGRKVAEGVRAWAVPGSEQTKADAEAEGLDRVFKDAGFEWRLPGCSLCVGANGENVPAGERCVSTSNRNFVGRQGPGSRTHLASPAMAAAAAVTGRVTDVRKLMDGEA
ncbi:MAG: 3-isopropylmalate dehydratase large subunit [Magnetovibrio sp.]|nr:3-isopropylmalate dehydratase large subunit [Magnetovibrio sp.]